MKTILSIPMWILVTYFFIPHLAHTQTLAQDLLKVKNTFMSPEPIQASIDLKYFKNEKDALPAVAKKGLFKRWGNDRYYSIMDGKEYLINKKYTLFVDKSHKLMVVKNTDPSPKNRSQELSVPEINKEQESKYHISKTVSGELITYNVAEKTNPQNRFTMELESGAYRLRKIVYFGGNSYARTEITYTYTSPVVFSESEFSESKYFTKTAKNITPTAAYAGYELNNQTR